MELLKNLEGLSADEQMTAVVELQKAAMKHLEEQKQASIGKSAELVIQGLKKIKSDFEAKFDSLNYDIQTKVASLKDGEQGLQGPKGDQGDRGLDGSNGRDGRDGKDGKDGIDGVDGVGVRDAKIDFDGSLVISLTDGREINCGEVVSVDVAKQIQKVTHNIQTGSGGDSQTVLDAIAALQATIATYGTMATQNANNVAITGGAINNTTIGATTPSTGVFTTLTATGTSNLGTGSSAYLQVTGGSGNVNLDATASTGNVDVRFSSRASGNIIFRTAGGTTQAQVSHTASAVNYVQVTGAATGGLPTISAQGSDAAVGLFVQSKGTSPIILQNGSAQRAVRIDGTGAGTNYFNIVSSATTQAPIFSIASASADTNVSAVFQSKGTGAIDLAAGSSGVNISNGGTVTAITRTATGSGYTSAPSVAISAPTTAGGVQATGVSVIQNLSATIAGGGTGYTVGDTITMVGGTLQSGGAGTFRVASVSGGVITSVDTSNFSQYLTPPANPVSVTGGTGSGATLTVSYIFGYVVITNAGSGYVEQPTVTFSGGGGSGASAVARVGSDTTVRSLGLNLSFFTPGGESFRVTDTGGVNNAYGSITGSQYNRAYFGGGGSATNIDLQYTTKGTGGHSFWTNGGSQEQVRVTHTASAVNYVQVTGAATGTGGTISAQGSDTNIPIFIQAKNSGWVESKSNGKTAFIAYNSSSSAVNYIQVDGQVTGFGASVSAKGSDTNIPLVLQPKGTGALQAQQTDSTATGGNARGANAVDWQTARGLNTQVASGGTSTISGGANNISSGAYAVVSGGLSNIASSTASVSVGGYANTASGSTSTIVGGFSNTSGGYYNFIGTGQSNSATSGSAVTTQATTTVTSGSTAVTLSGSNASIKVGQLIAGTGIPTYPHTYVAAISGTSLTLSQNASATGTPTLSFFTPHGVVVGGGNNQATGAYSFIGGGGDAGTAANRNVAGGDWSVVAGGRANNINSGSTGSVIAGGGDYGGGASGNTITSAASTISGGFANTVTAYGSVITGGAGNTANGQYSVVLGSYAATTRSIQGNVVIGSNAAFSGTQGTTQLGIIALNSQTTDATATVLRSNTSAAGTTNQVILPNNSAYYFRGEVVSGVTGGGNTKGWTIEGVIKRGANAASTTLVGSTVTSMYADVGAATWTIALSADTTNGGLAVTFTGQAATTIRTVAQIRTTEMTY